MSFARSQSLEASPRRRPTLTPLEQPARTSIGPTIGLALGGGGARGLAHLLVLEAFDDLGLKPHIVAGTSIGALFGATYAAGLSARMIRAHTEELLSQRLDLLRQVFAARAQPISRLFSFMPVRNALLDAPALLEAVLPDAVPRTFEELAIPLRTVACDFYAQAEVVSTTGDLRRAIAASIALPVLFAPVMVDHRAMVDGGFVNPLPFDVVARDVALTVAIDVSGGAPDLHAGLVAEDRVRTHPSAMDVLGASSQILQRSIVREKLRLRQPDVLIACPVGNFLAMEFHKWREILAASAPVKDQVKRLLDRVLSGETLVMLPHAVGPDVALEKAR